MTLTTTERGRLTVVRADRLFDGTGAAAASCPSVVIDGDTIVAVGQVPDGATVVDLPGATILPGLVDGHVHLAFDAGDDPVGSLARRDDTEVFAAMAVAARRAARGGVTTVRDLGDRDYLSLGLRAIAAGDPTLPTIVAAGPPITTVGGHCHFLGGAATAGVRAAVRARATRGVDVVKIMASGGNMTEGSDPGARQFDVAELRAAVKEAHRHGLPVVVHAHGTRSIADAVAAGVDGIEHVTFMTADGVDPAPDTLLETIARRRITLGVTVGIAPVEGATPPPEMLARIPALFANARKLYQTGAPMIAGTDAGIAPIKPPDAIRWAMPQLTQIGMTPAEALRACTSAAATACGLGHRKGRIAPGYDADLLIVDGDPLRDPAALHRIRAVYVRGTAIVAPTGVESAGVASAGVASAIVAPTGVEPTGVEPAIVAPAVIGPAVVESAAVEPTVVGPAVDEPTGVEPTAVAPAVVDPVAVEPTGVETTARR